ncbi:hypothetical protein [Lacipirellula parvula]|uniref:hypothetical protein n=1 Tax=Lacipirellula parvula TaxID=2650471 RepID=UPI00126093AA|nr:hypothetical protein [Lacipirellula parvula]
MLNDAASLVDLVESKSIVRDLTAEQITAILEFGTILRQNAGKINDGSNEFLIEQDKHWQAIRLAAQRCFAALTGEDVEQRPHAACAARRDEQGLYAVGCAVVALVAIGLESIEQRANAM